MCKKLIFVSIILCLAATNAMALPYIGQVSGSWATSSKVTATASSSNGPINYAPDRTTNGGPFNDAGEHHTSGSTFGWLSLATSYGNGAGNPAGLSPCSATDPCGVRQWIPPFPKRSLHFPSAGRTT